MLLQAWDRKDENKVRKILSSPWKISRERSFFVCDPMAVITVEPARKTSAGEAYESIKWRVTHEPRLCVKTADNCIRHHDPLCHCLTLQRSTSYLK